MTEQLISGVPGLSSPLAPLAARERVQIEVRRVTLPWLGTHVLYLEDYLYEEPFERRRRVLMSIEPAGPDGTLRVRQFTRRVDAGGGGAITAGDLDSIEGCDLFLVSEDGYFHGGTRDRHCLEHRRREPQWVDYRVVIQAGMFWYRQQTRTVADDLLIEEIAAFPHDVPEQARPFSCRMHWTPPDAPGARHALETLRLHDRGGVARFRMPDGRELQLELHGRYWPLASRRESLVLILRSADAQQEALASSWSSMDAAHVGVDVGWLAVDCVPLNDDESI